MSAYPSNNMYGSNGWQQMPQNQQWQNMSNEYSQSNEYAPMSNQNALEYSPSSSLSYFEPSTTSFSNFSPSTSSIYSPTASNSASDGTGNIINYGTIYNITGNNDVVNTGSGTLNYNSAASEPFSYFMPETAAASTPVSQIAQPVQQYTAPVEQYAAPIQQYTPPLQQYVPPMMQSLMASNASNMPWMQQDTDPMQDCNIWDQPGNNMPQCPPPQSCNNGGNDNQLLGMLLQILTQQLQGNNSNNHCGGTGTTGTGTGSGTTTGTGNGSGTKVWGDPHFVDSAGHQVNDMIAAGTNSMLVNTDSANGAHIIGQTGSWNNAQKTPQGTPVTVFTKQVVNLGDGTRIQMNANGAAEEVDANGNVLSTLTNGQTVTSSTNKNDSVTYNANKKTLKFNFADTNGSNAINGVIQVHSSAKGKGNYLDTTIKNATGNDFSGMLPNLKTSFVDSSGNPITVNEKTGAGAFKHNMTNADFVTDSLYS